MPRIARPVFAGVPHYITQRGNRREDVFFNEADRAAHLTWLGEYCAKYNEPLSTGDRRQVNTYSDGTVQTKLFKTNGEETMTAPDGTVTTKLEGPDPRFGILAPVPISATTKLPSGLTATATTARTATLTDPDDRLSLILLTDTVTVNGKAYKRSYKATTKTWTNTSPAGRHKPRPITTTCSET